ncbi:MAG: hypothetical protein AB7J35_18355 [Dehalococcoidia bacterium]
MERRQPIVVLAFAFAVTLRRGHIFTTVWIPGVFNFTLDGPATTVAARLNEEPAVCVPDGERRWTCTLDGRGLALAELERLAVAASGN